MRGEALVKAKQRNFVPARSGFVTVFIMVFSTVLYDIIYKLPSSKYDAGLGWNFLTLRKV